MGVPHAYKVGQRVKVVLKLEEAERGRSPHWSRGMDETVGKYGTIRDINYGTGNLLVLLEEGGGAWYYHPESLAPADAPVVPTPTPSLPFIIGISGKAGVGKTTTANHLLDAYGGNTIKLSFADALKREVAEEYGFPLEWCYTEEGKNTKIRVLTYPSTTFATVRKLLQEYGQNKRHTAGRDYWVNIIRHSLLTAAACGKTVAIIDDVRQENEAEFIKEHGGLLVRIQMAGQVDAVGQSCGHISETALDTYHHFDAVFSPQRDDIKQTEAVAEAIEILAEYRMAKS